MKVNLEKAIENIKIDVGFFRPLYEAIVNSIQANATEINISFEIEKQGHLDLISGYTIKDNGHGFQYDDIDAFLTLWTEHNSDKGALGSGRVLCLKVFGNIIIESQTKNSPNKIGQKVNIDFNKKFSFNTVDEIDRIDSSSDKSYTITQYKNLTEIYQEKKEPLNLEVLKREFFIELLPLFIEYNENNKDLTITLNGEDWINKNTLSKEFKEQEFKKVTLQVPSSKKNDKTKYNFVLTYRIEKDSKNKINQFYGASFRKVKDFPGNTKIKRLPDNSSGIFCLSGDYLNDRVDDSRENFTLSFNENNASDAHPLLFRDINKKLTEEINKILKNEFSTIEEKLEIEKHKAIEEYPYLTQYIKKINKLGINKTDIVKMAHNEFEKKYKNTKKEIIDFTNKIEKTKEFKKDRYIEITKEFTEVGQEQLAHYIAYRQTLIEMLFHVYECNNDKTKESFNEDYIHNLIMPQKKIKFDNKHIITENNFWLLDDKFMSFSYAASDVEIEKIVKSLSIEINDDTMDFFGDDRPDLMMLYSDETGKERDVVIVELKKVNISSYDRSKAVDQINLYADIVRETFDNINDIFVYAVVDLDHKLERILRTRSFLPKAYTKDNHNMKSYYMYNPNNQSHVNILSFYHLISDANFRNKLFLDILRNEITSSDEEGKA